MGKFFDSYPVVVYDIFGTRDGSYKTATNIFSRTKILDSVKSATSLYYDYSIQDGDTPEMIADKYYGDPELHWVILYMNDIFDPFYDWPLDYNKFVKFIKLKYGSIEAAQTTTVQYRKKIIRYDSGSKVTTTSIVTIDSTEFSGSPVTQNNVFNLKNGTAVTETIIREQVKAWDFELEENEKKRSIKLLRKEYIGTVKNQFQQLTTSLPKVADTVLTAGSQSVRLRK